MTACLALRLAGPLQSWGTESRFSRRTTGPSPSKSGVLGLLAAAQGRRRTDPLEDLLTLRFGVRVDQPGRLVRDFQTARSLDGTRTLPLSYRFYLADAVFLAVVEGDDVLIESLDDAVRSPEFPLFLGRRSCPPAGPVTLGIRRQPLDDVITGEPWLASQWWQDRSSGRSEVRLDTYTDVDPTAPTTPGPGAVVGLERDVPISFDPRRREYAWRDVARGQVPMRLTDRTAPGTAATTVNHLDDPHDPMLALGGS